jgi:hypothetical protein
MANARSDFICRFSVAAVTDILSQSSCTVSMHSDDCLNDNHAQRDFFRIFHLEDRRGIAAAKSNIGAIIIIIIIII